jgi:type IV secretory pathway VirB3-like protein
VNRTPLFIGLTRPVSYLGLPISYVVIMAMVVMGGFILLTSFTYLIVSAVISYVSLRALASYDPRIFDVIFTTVQRTPLTASLLRGHGVTYRA